MLPRPLIGLAAATLVACGDSAVPLVPGSAPGSNAQAAEPPRASAPSANARGSGLRILPEGPPNCDIAITTPIMPNASGTFDEDGTVHLKVGAYVAAPAPASVLADGGGLRVTIASSDANGAGYCILSYAIYGAPQAPFPLKVIVEHGGGRPATRMDATLAPTAK
jgi:hypothetical protein